MANAYTESITLGGGGTGSISFSWWLYQAYSDEAYKTDLQMLCDYTYKTNQGIWGHDIGRSVDLSGAGASYGGRAAISIEDVLNSAYVTVHTRPSLLTDNAPFSGEKGESRQGPTEIVMTPYSSAASWPSLITYTDLRVIEANLVIQTNIPIFMTNAEASDYIEYGDNIASAINNQVPSVEGRAFQITNVWTEGTWSANGNFTPGVGATAHHRDVRGRIIEDQAGKIAMYPEPGIVDNGITYRCIVSGTVTDLEYSEDGITWIPTRSFPYDYFYRPRIDEVGTFRFALTFYTDRIPIFKDAETVDGYIDGDVGVEEAENWPEISNSYPGGEIHNTTGDPDDGTDWGDVYTESFFHKIYLLGEGALREISNKLYDITPGVWEDIAKGLQMFGDNPIESVMSLMYFPIDLSSVFHNVSNTTSIYFGGYQFTMTSHTADKLIYPQGYFECGSVSIKPTFNNWRDVKTTRIFVDLPYCGRYELDPQKYIGKEIKVIYYIDLYSGGCLACLVEGATGSRDGVCLDQFNGVIGQRLPITLTDFAGHANAMINTLLGGGGQAITAGQSIGETGAHAALTSGSGAGAALALGGAAAGGAALGGITAAKTIYGLQMNNINKFNQTRGGSSGMLNQYANQKPTFIFVYPDTDIPDNFNAMYGTPSNVGGSIGSFSGYFEADTVRLNMPGATESEKAKARDLLMNGIYIQ